MGGEAGGEMGGILEVLSLLQMVFILVWKYVKKDWPFSEVNDEEVLSCGLRRGFMVENRSLGLLEPEWMR